MNLLIFNRYAQECKLRLQPEFPHLTIHATSRADEIGGFIGEAEILLISRISDDMVEKAKKLQWIHSIISGVDYISNLPSLGKNVLITSTRGIHGPQMSELAFLLMLSLAREFPENVKNQERRIWKAWPSSLLFRKCVGILGAGVIGQEIARKCKAFGMTVYGITRIKRDIDAVDFSFGPEGLPEVLEKVDYFINVLPSTPQTRQMIGNREFEKMKPTAYFINIGRGDTVDEAALLNVLADRRIAGAALDVFRNEPLPADHPFWGMDNVIITPHMGGISDIYVEQALPLFEENLSRFLRGERRSLINLVELPG